MFRELIRRIGYLGRRARFDAEFGTEVEFHLGERAAELESEGLSRQEAVAQARREFGSRALATEDSRSAWQLDWIEQMLSDLRQAARSFARGPMFALTAICCLAIGVAANTLVFSLINAVFLRPLPYPDANRIVAVRFAPPGQPDQKLGSNSGTYFYVRDNSEIFERTGAIRVTGISISTEPGESASWEWVQAGATSPGLTDVMGVHPALGRWYAAEDGLGIVISDRLWKRMYGGAPDILSKAVYLEGLGAAAILGVMPAGYRTLNPDIDFWLLQPDENLAGALRSPNRVFTMFGRLKPGITLEQARAQLSALAPGLGQEYEMNRDWSIQVDSLRDVYVGYLRRPLLLLQGSVFLLLLIACANVGGLLLAQAATRQREMAVRAALGSSRWRIIRQMLTENLLLSAGGGVLGTLLAWAGLRAIVHTALASNVDLQNVALDWRVLGFALFISTGTSLAFGLLPALQSSRPDLIGAIRDSGRSLTASLARTRMRGVFVVAQVALALVLLTGSGLLIRSLLKLNAVSPGLNPENVVALQVPFPRSFYRTQLQNTKDGGYLVEFDDRLNAVNQAVLERLASVPGVSSVTASVTPPLGGTPPRVDFQRPGQLLSQREQGAWAGEFYPVSGAYFETLQIPLQRGRAIEKEDRFTSRPVAVINETLARQFFPGEDPVGRQIQLDVIDDPPREIVGVAGDVRQDRYQTAPQPQLYVPRMQLPYRRDMTMGLEQLVPSFLVRTGAVDPASLAPVLRAAIRDVDPSLPVSSVRTVSGYAAGQLEDAGNYAALLALFGAVSLALALIGIFGLIAHSVSQRSSEIGIRVALGARRSNVVGLIVREGVRLIAAGLVAGLAASFLLTPMVRGFLWGIDATDPLTFVLAAGALAIVALLACYLPALRAMKIDPVITLRDE